MREVQKPIIKERLQKWEKFCKTKAYKKARFKKARMRLWGQKKRK